MGGPIQLSSGIQKIRNNQSEDFHDEGRMKFLGNLRARARTKWKCIVGSDVENTGWSGQEGNN